MNLSKETETDRRSEQTCGCRGGGGGRGMDGELGMSCYVERVTAKSCCAVLCVQSPVRNHNEKEYTFKKWK